MAVFIPNVKPDDFNNSYGEKKVYEALRSLDDRHTVFYSLNWVGVNESRTLGEADFVIAHPDKGILVIEVKSGEIAYQNGTWTQTNTATGFMKEIDPFGQARKSQFELMDRLRASHLGFRLPMFGYCAWFPSVEMPGDRLPPEAPESITLDERSLGNPEASIDDCFSYWAEKFRPSPLDIQQFKRVVDVLCPHFRAVPKLKTRANEMEASYIRLTNQQAALLDFLEEQPIAVIHGLAGTGKTVLAVEKAKRLASQNDNVLFLCYNSFLRKALMESSATPGVTFHNAHSLAYEMMPDPSASQEDSLSEFEDYLEEVFDVDDWKYSNVIVDEGQDLDDRLLNRIYELVRRKRGCFYVFYDRNQYILKNELPRWIDEAECRLVLHKNCRNTAEVFKTSCSIMGLSNVDYNDIHGEKPHLSFYKTTSDVESIVESFVKQAISGGLAADDIAILTAKTTENSWIDLGKEYGGKELSPTREPGKVLFTTIRKFKGLEAEAVLIIDASMSLLSKIDNKRLLYVGASRARSLLCIAMLEDIERCDMGDFIAALAPDRSLPKNKKGLKRLLNVEF